MKKFYTFIFAFLILILSGFIFIKTINATHDPNYPPCGHNYLQGSFFSNNQSNIIWQVGFRVIYNYNQPGEENGVVWKDLVDYTTCSSGNHCVFIDTKTLRNDDAWKPYRLQWGTGCIDPVVKPNPVEETRSCNEWYVFNGQNVTMSRANLENLGIPTSSGSYNYLDDIAWYESNGGKTIWFGGFKNIDNCPRAPRYSIDGHVYVDKNGDGNWDPNGQNGSPDEPAYSGAIIKKTGDGNPEPDTTGNNGYYRFYNLPSGNNYKVEFTNKPNGYVFTKPTDGTWTGIDLPPNHTVANGNPFNFGIAPKDLIVSDFTYQTGVLNSSGTNDPTIKIKNIGNAQITNDFVVRICNGNGDCARHTVTQVVSPQEVVPLSSASEFQNMLRPPAGNNWTATATVDVNDDITESKENNNDSTQDYKTTSNVSGVIFVDTNGDGDRAGDSLYTGNITIKVAGVNYPTSNGNYKSAELDAGIYPVTMLTIPANYNLTTPDNLPVRVTLGRNKVVNFGIQPPVPAWYQGVGGDMSDDNKSSVTIPSGQYFSIAQGKLLSPGVIFNFDVIGNKSVKNWFINSPLQNKSIKTSYDYVSRQLRDGKANQINLFGVGGHCGPDDGSGCRIDNPNGGYYYTDGKNVILDAIDFRANQDYIFRIDGNLTINTGATPWNIPNGTTAIFVVKGNIIVNSNVTHLEGIFSADGDFRVRSKSPAVDSQLIIEGSVIANSVKGVGKFVNRRDLGDTDNQTIPAVKIIFRPDFVLNAPDLVRYSNYNFHEAAPSGR